MTGFRALQDSDEYKWKDHAYTNPPPARARHAALAVGDMSMGKEPGAELKHTLCWLHAAISPMTILPFHA